MTTKILLKGYFGAGNLGDDILMCVSYSLIKEFYQTNQIVIWGAKQQSIDTQYINHITNQQLSFITEISPAIVKNNILVLGGGGLFFEFANSAPQILRTNSTILTGINKVLSKKQVSSNRHFLSAEDHFNYRFAIGLGLGPFENNSKYSEVVADYLSQFELVIVRDPTSYDLCTDWRIEKIAYLSSDLAYLTHRWLPNITQDNKITDKKLNIGCVIRDWNWNSEGIAYIDGLISVVQQLRRFGHNVTFVSFNHHNDSKIFKRLPQGEKIAVWSPFHQTIQQFLQSFAKFDIVVTARAHGAIIASCLGIPSVSIVIEPKLEIISQMTGANLIWKSPFDTKSLLQLIEHIREKYEYYQEVTKRSFITQRELAVAGEKHFLSKLLYMRN